MWVVIRQSDSVSLLKLSETDKLTFSSTVALFNRLIVQMAAHFTPSLGSRLFLSGSAMF